MNKKNTCNRFLKIANKRLLFIRLGYGKNIESIKSKEKVAFANSFDALQIHTLEKFINPFINIQLFFPKDLPTSITHSTTSYENH